MLCHNDCHLGNILSTSKEEYIIDYEFCQFNYLGYDLGNFLNEWAT
jgi:thiamine kinase-like enzyme